MNNNKRDPIPILGFVYLKCHRTNLTFSWRSGCDLYRWFLHFAKKFSTKQIKTLFTYLISYQNLIKIQYLTPLHVLWEVSFGFWVMWFISSWQENYKSVFFPKLQFLNDKLQIHLKKLFGNLAKLLWSFYHSKVCKLEK